MLELKQIQMSFFLLLLLLHFAAVSGQYSHVDVRVGDRVTLPCRNLTAQDNCDGVNWLFVGLGSKIAAVLFHFGEIGEHAEDKSDRVSVTNSCSLVIKTVSAEDVGLYTCRKSEHGGANVYLSVITMTERQDADEVTLNCSASTLHERCEHRVKWLYEGERVDGDVETSEPLCSVSRTFPASRLKQKFKCEVTNLYTGEVQLFPFNPSATKPTVSPTTFQSTAITGNTWTSVGMGKSEDKRNKYKQQEVWWRLIIVSAGLSALIISVVTVNIWTRTKGNKTQTDGNTEHEDEGAVVYENTGEPSASVRLH